jgi:hypothetical protein
MFQNKLHIKIIKSTSFSHSLGTSSIDWTQLSRSHLKMETESGLRNVVGFLERTRRWIMCSYRTVLSVRNNCFSWLNAAWIVRISVILDYILFLIIHTISPPTLPWISKSTLYLIKSSAYYW